MDGRRQSQSPRGQQLAVGRECDRVEELTAMAPLHDQLGRRFAGLLLLLGEGGRREDKANQQGNRHRAHGASVTKAPGWVTLRIFRASLHAFGARGQIRAHGADGQVRTVCVGEVSKGHGVPFDPNGAAGPRRRAALNSLRLVGSEGKSKKAARRDQVGKTRM